MLAIAVGQPSTIVRAVLPAPDSGVTALFCAFWGFWVTMATWRGSPQTYGAKLGFGVGLVCWGVGAMLLFLGWALTHARVHM